MTDLPQRLRAHVRDAGLFPEPGLALLAVSGGPDSMALLDLCADFREALGLALAVAHVDHGIHAASAAVARDVAAQADRYGVPCHTVRLELGAEATETEARRARYRALRGLQRDLGARYLVTGHHADDQIETVLYRVLRGSGVAGLAGIPATGAGGLVRPLLPFTHRELQDWVRRRALPAHADPANLDPRHDRSWVRQHLLPELRGRFGDVDDRLLEVASDAARHRRAWSAMLRGLPGLIVSRAEGWIEVARPPLQEYHKTLSEVLLRAAAREVGCRVGPRRAARLLRFSLEGRSGRSLDLGEGWHAELVFDRVRILRASERQDPGGARELCGDEGALRFGTWQLQWRREVAGRIERRSLVTWAPVHHLAIRAWMPGDRMVPLGGVGRRKVRRLLMEARIPFRERRTYPLLVRGDEILWIPGVCRSAVATPDPGAPALRVEAIPADPPPGNTARADGY